MESALLSVRDLSVEYVTATGSVRAVEGLSFELARGEALGLAGESGSGKSTAVHALLRLLPAPGVITGGTVRFDGKNLLELEAAELARVRWREVSLVFQSSMNALNPVLRVGAQIADVIRGHAKVSRRAAAAQARELLTRVGIDRARAESYPHELSGGMRQRVVIAVALALGPKLLILDEPTTALDVLVEREILVMLSELRRELEFSMLFITHDLPLMLEFCDRVGVLYAGRLVECAKADDLLREPLHPYSRGLLSSTPRLSGARERLAGIAGQPPDPRRPPSGCRFQPRCASAVADCSTREPPLVSIGSTRLAACHLVRSETREATP